MIRVRGLRKSYGRREVLRDVELSVAPGERVALVGPNGSGKTTLMRCLLGLVRASGTVTIAGHDPWTDHVAAQTHVAYVPQRAPTLAVPVADVVRLWTSTRPAARPVEPCAEALGLDLRDLMSARFTELSGGMQQKLLVAMALCSGAAALFCDEPTANLDPAARGAFLAMLAELDPAPSLVLSSHRLDEIRRLVNRVVVLAEGRVVFDDAVDAFLSDPTLAAAAGVESAHHADGTIIPFDRRSR